MLNNTNRPISVQINPFQSFRHHLYSDIYPQDVDPDVIEQFCSIYWEQWLNLEMSSDFDPSPSQLEGLGSAVSSLSGVWGSAPVANNFAVFWTEMEASGAMISSNVCSIVHE